MSLLKNIKSKPEPKLESIFKQGGVVLFLALVALVIMSLAAVALIRSVDTSTLIAGNLSFKEAATTSADGGVEAAIALLEAMRDDPLNAGKTVSGDATHTFNVEAKPGYFSSSADPALDLLNDDTWNAANNNAINVTWTTDGLAKSDGSGAVVTDSSGNRIQYIIQRMCRIKNVRSDRFHCLYSKADVDNNGQEVKLPQNICIGLGCPASGQTPQLRVTVRTVGPKNSVSYVQAFVY